MQIQHAKLSNRDYVTIMPLGDIQWTLDRSKVAVGHLKENVERALNEDAYFIGLGDYTDAVSPSNRDRLHSVYEDVHDFVEAAASKALDELYEEVLEPTTGRWLGLTEGHHFLQYRDGSTTDTRLAEMLETDHLGSMGYVHLNISHWKWRPSILAWHGAGAGQTAGAMANRIDKMREVAEADVYLMGHMTRLTHVPMTRMTLDSDDPTKLMHKNYHLVGTGGYERGYQEGRAEGLVPRGTYVEKAAMRPTALGSPLIRIYKSGRITVEI